MRLIDADRAIEIVRNRGVAHPNAYHLTNYATLILQEAPTVDAVEVVRCKDCHYNEDEEIGMVYCPYVLGGWVGENWFCADGERKENK